MKPFCTFLLCLLHMSGFGWCQSNTIKTDLPDVRVKMHLGRPTIYVGDKPVPFTAYCSFGSPHLKDRIPFFFNLGMKIFFLEVARLPFDYNSSRFWVGDRVDSTPLIEVPKDFYGIDQQAEQILGGEPDAYLIVRFVLRPPQSWCELHPSEFFITEEGEVTDIPSLASDAYWGKAAEFAGVVVRYTESTPWANHVIGYANFFHTEGAHMPVADGWLFDHSPLMTWKLREYLRVKYGTVEKLRTTYGDSTLTFETVRVPKDKLRGPTPEVAGILYWQDTRDNRPLRDYLELTRNLFHRGFRLVGGAMESAADRNVLIIHDALKQTMLGWNLKGFFGYPSFGEKVSWSPAYPELLAGSGHMNAAALDGAPGYDGLITPHDYQARGLGGVYEPEGIVDSVVLRGMFFAGEMDTRFHKKNDIGPARDEREAAVITWRNYASTLTRGFGSYLCYGFQVEDWFYTEPVADILRRQVRVMNESIGWPHETVPGIAMILDDSAVLETNGAGNFFNEAIMWEQKMGLARCGVPFRIYLFEDLALDAFPKHRVYYFPNLFRADDARLELLKKKVFRDGNIVVWGPGSGISDGERIGTESASKLTGFSFTMLSSNAQRRILISNFDHPVTHGLSADMVIGGTLAYGPVLMPTDGVELGLAWAKGGMNHIGMSLKEFGKGAAGNGGSGYGAGDYAAIFMTAVQIPADLWRNIARYAGAHIYCDSNDILMADNNIVALHSIKPERKTIRLPEKCPVYDLVNDRQVSWGTREITFDMKAPDTRVFLLSNR